MAEESSEKKKEVIRAVKFALFSASAGLIEAGTIFALEKLTPFPSWACYLCGLVLSVLWNFTLNRKFTFQSAANVPVAMLKVAAYYAVFTPVTTVLGNYLEGTCGWNGMFVTVMNMLLNFVTEYLYDRFVVFGKSIDTNSRARSQSQSEGNE